MSGYSDEEIAVYQAARLARTLCECDEHDHDDGPHAEVTMSRRSQAESVACRARRNPCVSATVVGRLDGGVGR